MENVLNRKIPQHITKKRVLINPESDKWGKQKTG